jgi:cell division protein FtsB
MKGIPIFARFLIVAFIVGIVLVLSSAWREMERSKRIEDEVAKLQSEADRIRNENRSISEKLSYFATPDFEEREAKEKLGMKKDDEEVVSVEVGSPALPASESKDNVLPHQDGSPNHEKWIRFFLKGSEEKNK